MEGQGKMKFRTNRNYEGGWFNDRYHGLGTYTYPNLAKYRGYWKDGKQHGEGQVFDD